MVTEKLIASADQLPHHIYVDLDGTLTPCDTMWECVAVVFKQRPWLLMLLPILLFSGRQRIKAKLAEWGQINFKLLPFRIDLVDWLQERRRAGHRIVMATAANVKVATAVAERHHVFDCVLASDNNLNLKARKKAQAIRDDCDQEPFLYIGDSKADQAIWKEAKTAVAIGARGVSSLRQLKHSHAIYWPLEQHRFKHAIRAMRPHHWAKNALVFVPLVTAHIFSDLQPWLSACLAFLSFSLTSSAVYLINDLVDLEADRQHHLKKARPMASGVIPIWAGLTIAISCLASSLTLSLWLPSEFRGYLVTYGIVTLIYSLVLKQLAMVDVITLAGLFTLRVLAGGAATSTPISPWLLAFALFFFLSLAVLKRFAEIHHLKTTNRVQTAGRGYHINDGPMLSVMGISNGYISVLVLALYINSPGVNELYNNPFGIWLICPALIYWLSRVWLKAQRGLMLEDPLVYAFRDPASYLVGVFVLVVMLGSL